MWGWMGRNAEPLQGLGALVTALAALAAIVIIPVQISAADRIQRDQTAREIYREFLNLTVQKPELAEANFCALTDEKTRIAYGAYVEYLLYTAEQMIGSDEGWREPMAEYMADHMPYLCSNEDWSKQAEGVFDMVMALRSGCAEVESCAG